MKTRDIIVIGASAGGVEALGNFVSRLPEDFKGSVFIVLHIPAYSESHLPDILEKAGPLKAIHPIDGQAIQPGMIYIAPADHHMILDEDGKVLIKKGPKENRFRPSIDALFRSAAYVYGTRVTGIILSGMLDDGSSGLWTIKRLGGIAIIQNPEEAQQSQMPLNAMKYVNADYVADVADMAPIIAGLIKEPPPGKFQLSDEEMKRLKMEIVIAMHDNAFEMGIMDMGELTPFTCPECYGALVRLTEDKIIRYRCHTGHAYTASSLLAELTETIEDMLWRAMRGMEEMSMLLKKIGEHYEKMNDPEAAALFFAKKEDNSKKARAIHGSIFKQEQYSEDLRFDKKKR